MAIDGLIVSGIDLKKTIFQLSLKKLTGEK